MKQVRLLHGVKHLLRHQRHFRRRAMILDQDDEFVATQPRQQVGIAHAGLDACRDHLQQTVTGIVSQRVVDDLEPVEVDEQHREHAAYLALCMRPSARRDIHEHGADKPVSSSWKARCRRSS